MIEFRTLPDDHRDVAHLLLLRALRLTLRYGQDRDLGTLIRDLRAPSGSDPRKKRLTARCSS